MAMTVLCHYSSCVEGLEPRPRLIGHHHLSHVAGVFRCVIHAGVHAQSVSRVTDNLHVGFETRFDEPVVSLMGSLGGH